MSVLSKLRRLAIVALLVSPDAAVGESAVRDGRPNVVLILSDDQAWTDYGFMGHEEIKTPNLDRLAKEGVVFKRGYVPTSLCRPSLVTMITGHYPHTHLTTGNDPWGRKDPSEAEAYTKRCHRLIAQLDEFDTLPRLLTREGYLTHQSGKWWEGGYRRGGFTHGMTRGFPEPGGRHGDDGLVIGREGLQPVEEFLDLAVSEEKPFFLWYAPLMPHTPHNPPRRLLEKYASRGLPQRLAKYYAMCEWFDETCGDLIELLEAKNVRDNTLIVYLTDNGWLQDPERNQFALHSKGSPYEAGVRTPIIFSWPGALKPADRPELVSSIDLFPTIAALVGAKAPKDFPGLDLSQNLRTGSSIRRDAIYGEVFAHDIADIEDAEASLLYRWVIEGDWKLIGNYDGSPGPTNAWAHMGVSAPLELYDLASDPTETTNLAGAHPALAQRLAERIERWRPLHERKLIAE